MGKAKATGAETMNKGRQITGTVVVLTVVILSLFDVWVLRTYGSEATISWVTWTSALKFPVIPFAAGVLCGHLFWKQRTGDKI